jgi:dipeptidase E
MKTLFLSSKFSVVAEKFVANFPITPGMTAAFILTAADMYETKPWMDEDRQALVDMGIAVEDCDIKNMSEEKLYTFLHTKDIIFVAGGNTFYLLDYANRCDFGSVLARLLHEGKVYVGSSAGSALAGSTIEPARTFDNPDAAPNLTSFAGLGLVDVAILPHYGSLKYEERYQAVVREWSGKVKLQLLRDNEAMVVRDEVSRVV